jgi:hypothetical protein
MISCAAWRTYKRMLALLQGVMHARLPFVACLDADMLSKLVAFFYLGAMTRLPPPILIKARSTMITCAPWGSCKRTVCAWPQKGFSTTSSATYLSFYDGRTIVLDRGCVVRRRGFLVHLPPNCIRTNDAPKKRLLFPRHCLLGTLP